MSSVDEIVAGLVERALTFMHHKPLCAIVGGYGYCNCGMERAREDARAALATALATAEWRGIERAVDVCREQEEAFASPEYATGQPLASLQERFACRECAAAILALTPETRP